VSAGITLVSVPHLDSSRISVTMIESMGISLWKAEKKKSQRSGLTSELAFNMHALTCTTERAFIVYYKFYH